MAAGPPPEVVNASPAIQQDWSGVIGAVASVVSTRGVSVSNDTPGIVTRIYFDSGATVRQGQVLVELDASVERAQLGSAEARGRLAELSRARSARLVEAGALAPVQLDVDETSFQSLSADAKALRAQIDRKIVRAPFSGRLGLRQVNLGQYLAPGTPIAVLESTEETTLDFAVPQQQMEQVAVGMTVRALREVGSDVLAYGRIAAIDPTVDPMTRSVKIRAHIEDDDGRLRPGMYLRAEVVLPMRRPVVAIPSTAVIHAPYGDSVFLVEPSKNDAGKPLLDSKGQPHTHARQQFVRLGPSQGDFVAVLDGIRAGQELVTEGAFKLRNGTPVKVDNRVKLKPELRPHPQKG